MEHRQRVQVDIAIGDRRVPAERHGVEPEVPVRELHALGPGRRAAGVVDARGRVLIWLPADGLGIVGSLGEQFLVSDPVKHDPVLGLDVAQRLV
jgi:hypothetical protein